MNGKQKSRSKKRMKKSYILPLLGLIAVTVLIIFGLTRTHQTTIYASTNYFAISNAGGLARYGAGNTTVILRTLIFNFTPIGGDAHHVEVRDPTESQTEANYYWDLIPNGTSTNTGDIQISGQGLILSKVSGGYQISTVTIGCDEARGAVTIFIPENDLAISPALTS